MKQPTPFGHVIAPGNAPALLVIDFLNAYTMEDGPLYTPSVITAANNTVPLIARFRKSALPIIFTKVEYQTNGLGGGLFAEKIPALRMLLQLTPGVPSSNPSHHLKPTSSLQKNMPVRSLERPSARTLAT